MTIRSRQRRPLTTLLSTCYTFRNCFENCVNLSLSFIKWIRTYFSISIVTLEFFFILIRSYYYQWIDTSACGLLVPEGIIHQVVSVSVLTWFIRYIVFSKMYCYQIIQLLLKSPPPLRVPQPIVASLFWFSCSTSMEKKSFDLFSNTQYDVTLETTDFFVVFF